MANGVAAFGKAALRGLAERGYAVRHLPGQGLPQALRITIGTASDLEEVTRGEVIKYSAGGFRDFTRIAASDPTMWRDVFLNNREAVLEMLDRFLTDLAMMREAIRASDGTTMFDLFTRTREIRRSIVAIGQDDARPDFGRKHNGDS